MKTIETKRLYIRDLDENDVEDFYEYAKVKGVGEMAGWRHHSNIEESLSTLKMLIDRKESFGIILKSTSKLIGTIGLHQITASDIIKEDGFGKELGFVIGKKYWNKGYATEAALAFIEYAFMVMKSDYLIAGHFTTNERSKNVIRKCGFTFIGNSMYNASLINKKEEASYYVLRKNEYYKNKATLS